MALHQQRERRLLAMNEEPRKHLGIGQVAGARCLANDAQIMKQVAEHGLWHGSSLRKTSTLIMPGNCRSCQRIWFITYLRMCGPLLVRLATKRSRRNGRPVMQPLKRGFRFPCEPGLRKTLGECLQHLSRFRAADLLQDL
jgi:hypothetical protein